MQSSHKLILSILFRFLSVYFILLLIYSYVLSLQMPDYFTLTTAKQVDLLYELTGYETRYEVLDNPAELGILTEDGSWLVRVIEGCNGVSVMIVFLAFVWAFPSEIKDKIKFSLTGIILIWLVNLLRIYTLGLIYHYRPGWFDISHRVFFPASVYGMVILLWMYWIRRLIRS